MKSQAKPTSLRDSALRRAIIRTIPNYYSWSDKEQELYRLNISSKENFRLQQSLLSTLFDIKVASREELDDARRDFDDQQYLLLNSTLLPFQGIGENNFFLNEWLAEGVTLLDFSTIGDYARDDHQYQQQARKRDDPDYEMLVYRGDFFPCWARLTIDGEFNYATVISLANQLQDAIDEAGTERINELIPHDYVEGKNHGRKEKNGTLFDFNVDAAGKERQLDELQHRYYKYMFTRHQQLLDKFDQESSQQVYIQAETRWHDPQINFVFSDSRALDAVRFRHFYKDCQRLAGNTAELSALAEQECTKAIEFLDRHYRDILDNFDPTVTRLHKKRNIILAEGVLDDIL